MVFLPVPVDASEIILDAGQLWIEHPRAAQQVEDGALGFVHLKDKLRRELQRFVDVRRFKRAIVQLEYPLREDGPVQQFGHDAVFGAEDGIDGLLGDPCLLSDGFHRCFGVPAFKEKALRGVKDVEAGLVCLTLADGRGILAGRVFFHLDSHPFGKYST